jgi:hypothetical protein
MRDLSSGSHGGAIARRHDQTVIEDPDLPAAAHLLGPGAEHLVAAGLAALGAEVRRLRSTQVVYRPGSELTVRYDATVAWGDGRVTDEVLCTGTTRTGAPPGTIPLAADGMEAGLWRYPFDPALPGLEPAVTPSGVAAVVGAHVGARPHLTVRAYRPGRRAVVHAAGDAGEAYLKVVRPASFDALVAVHRALHSAGLPVPEVIAGDPPRGILVLRALPGTVLRDRIRAGATPWPDARSVLDLLDRLASVEPPPGTGSAGHSDRATAAHLTMVARALPGGSARIADLRSELDGMALPDGPPILIHGDLHEAQLMVAGPRITGLLDIDGVGTGRRVDDLGRLLGHLSTLALGAGPEQPAIEAYVEALRRGFGEAVDLSDLDRRAAAVAVGLATGPFRVQMQGWEAETRRRLELARAWVARAAGDPAPATVTA